MASLSSFKNPTAYHLLSYGTLLGSTLFQSFINGIVAFRTLPRAQFSSLQKNIFPVYFTLQTLTPVAMVLTYPSWTTRILPSMLPKFLSSKLISTSTTATASSVAGASDTLPATLLLTMFVTGLVNLVWVGPKTTEIMRERKHQETRDGKKSWDKGPHSKEMVELNRQFSVLHGVSSLVNLVGFVGMIWYGVVLGEGLVL